jgi:hypothetical protein
MEALFLISNMVYRYVVVVKETGIKNRKKPGAKNKFKWPA